MKTKPIVLGFVEPFMIFLKTSDYNLFNKKADSYRLSLASSHVGPKILKKEKKKTEAVDVK